MWRRSGGGGEGVGEVGGGVEAGRRSERVEGEGCERPSAQAPPPPPPLSLRSALDRGSSAERVGRRLLGLSRWASLSLSPSPSPVVTVGLASRCALPPALSADCPTGPHTSTRSPTAPAWVRPNHQAAVLSPPRPPSHLQPLYPIYPIAPLARISIADAPYRETLSEREGQQPPSGGALPFLCAAVSVSFQDEGCWALSAAAPMALRPACAS